MKIFLFVRLTVNLVLFVFLTVLLSACTSINADNPNVDFPDLYTSILRRIDRSSNKTINSTYSLTCRDMKLADFAFWLVRECNCGLVFSEKLDDKLFSAEFVDATVPEMMSIIANRFATKVQQLGNTWYVGDLSEDDRSVFVRRVYGVTRDDLIHAVETLSGYAGKSYVTLDNVVVCTDRESTLTRLSRFLDSLEKVTRNTWIVQVYLVQCIDDSSLNLGFSNVTTGDISFVLSGFSSLSVNRGDLTLALSSLLSGKSLGSRLISSPMMLLSPGVPATWSDGKEVPVPNKTVSDSGTVTTSGFTRMQTGLQLSVTLTETLSGAGISFKLVDSSIVDYVEYSPVLSKTELSTSLDVLPAHTYLIGELRRNNLVNGVPSLFSWETTTNDSKILVFIRTYVIDHSKLGDFSSSGSEDGEKSLDGSQLK